MGYKLFLYNSVIVSISTINSVLFFLLAGDSKSWVDPGVLTALIVSAGAFATGLTNIYLRKIDNTTKEKLEKARAEREEKQRHWDTLERKRIAEEIAKKAEDRALQIALQMTAEADKLQQKSEEHHGEILTEIQKNATICQYALQTVEKIKEELPSNPVKVERRES